MEVGAGLVEGWKGTHLVRVGCNIFVCGIWVGNLLQRESREW